MSLAINTRFLEFSLDPWSKGLAIPSTMIGAVKGEKIEPFDGKEAKAMVKPVKLVEIDEPGKDGIDEFVALRPQPRMHHLSDIETGIWETSISKCRLTPLLSGQAGGQGQSPPPAARAAGQSKGSGSFGAAGIRGATFRHQGGITPNPAATRKPDNNPSS